MSPTDPTVEGAFGGGRAGLRVPLADKHGMVIGRDDLLRPADPAQPDPPFGIPEITGADDLAPRRGHVYGTVVIDILTHRHWI